MILIGNKSSRKEWEAINRKDKQNTAKYWLYKIMLFGVISTRHFKMYDKRWGSLYVEVKYTKGDSIFWEVVEL